MTKWLIGGFIALVVLGQFVGGGSSSKHDGEPNDKTCEIMGRVGGTNGTPVRCREFTHFNNKTGGWERR